MMDLKCLILAKLGMNSFKIESNRSFLSLAKKICHCPSPCLYVANQTAVNEFAYCIMMGSFDKMCRNFLIFLKLDVILYTRLKWVLESIWQNVMLGGVVTALLPFASRIKHFFHCHLK